ncbi:hypothetical protein F5144DRAFT_633818 [Chaetomium tenue]|uniref:Uncharacterized protein n=1 Tax=Chaetomium tenue TaxID=1854479 RepID=A0ACB7NWI0_9PEZI|nr:hypothetical protein F5144DRAFT_633818 [Chaetomium globosum]
MSKEKEMEMMEVVTDESYNSVWRIEKQELDDPNIDQPLCFWKIDPNVIPKLQAGPKAPIFFPFPDPIDPANTELMLLTETIWNDLRGTVKNKKPKNWARTGRGERTLKVTGEDGEDKIFTKFIETTPKTATGANDTSAFWVDTFDAAFGEGQKRAPGIAERIRKPWKPDKNITWMQRNGGSWTLRGGDQRTFETKEDGVGFEIDGWGGEPPSPTDRYVKLDPPDVEQLLLDEPAARTRGVSADQVYIPESVMQRLRKGEYPFKDRNFSVALLNATGDVEYVKCRTFVTGDWWEKAYWNGVLTQTEWKVARWRNVNGLELCFVVAGTGTTASELQQAVRQALADAIVPIKQTAIVVNTKPAEYSIFLSTSPFGDYETWIRQSDYVSYVQAYPGYALPTQKQVDAMIQAIDDMLSKRSETVRKRDAEFENGLKKADDSAGSKNADAGINVSSVSFDTIWRASGKRKGVPSQGQQMGGSATTVALAAEWANPRDRVKSQGTMWDSPGVYPAEWLHRSAFSWGNINDIKFPQSTFNLIFGSSEANSLMTRYEKAWQRLFVRERSLQKQLPGPAASQSRLGGTLTTTNTPDKYNILIAALGADSKSVQTVILTKGKTDKDAPTAVDQNGKEVLPEGGGSWPNYWAVARTCRNLSWCLTYELRLTQTGYFNVSKIPFVPFYPFRRGFYTRLEAEVDSVLLDNQEDRLLDTLAPPAQPSPPDKELKLAKRLVVSMENLSLNHNTSHAATAAAADVWERVNHGDPVSFGGVTLTNPSVATLDAAGCMVHIPLPLGESMAQDTAFVAQAPLEAADVGFATGDKAPTDTETTTLSAITGDMPQTASTDGDIPDGFVLQGTIKLFGLFDAPIYVYQGAAAEGTRQIIPLAAGMMNNIESFIPGLADSDYGTAIQLKQLELVYNEFTTATDRAGTWLQTDVIFSGPLQPVNDCLKNVFHQADPAVRVQALLTLQNNWSDPISPTGLALRGTLPGIDIEVGSLLRITQLGIDVGIGGSRQPWPPYNMAWTHTLGFSGSLLIDMPHDMAPLAADFLMLETQGVLTLIATAESVDKPGFAGLEGLQLSQVSMQTTVGMGEGASSAVNSLTATAELELGAATLHLYGFYNKNDWGFTCDLQGFSFADVRDVYQDLFGATLHITSHDVQVDDLIFTVRPSGMVIAGSVTVEGHASANATIAISRNGLEITGGVADVVLDGDIVLKSASLDIFVGREDVTPLAEPGTSFRFAIQGVVSVAGSDITASMFLDRDGSGNSLWTVVAGFKGDFSLATMASELRGTFLDLSVKEATFIASNVDGVAAAGAVIPPAYPVVKGVEIAGVMGPIPALDGALHTSVTGLTLAAVYSATSSSFELAIRLATSRQMSMKSGTVFSGPISLLVQASASPTLTVDADFFVVVPNRPEPLKFSGGLSVNIEEAKLFIELANQWWQNPFGLSPQIQLGPDIALQIGIVYAGPIYPSEIGVAAGLAVGSVSGKAALSISEAPNDELIMLHIDNLSIQDLVSFASLLLQTTLPSPPSNFLFFKNLDFYLSTGTTIGTTVYPPGASFNCDAVIFDHEATVFCAVSKPQGQIEVKGSLQAIDIGPVSVSGSKPGTPARLDVQFGPQQQTVLIDGGARLFDLNAQMLVKVVILPSPNFQLQTELDFTAHLTFQLQADMRGGFTSVKDLNFDVHAIFQQDILDYIATQVSEQVQTAKKGIDSGIESAQKAVDDAQAAFQAAVDDAQKQVDTTKAAYEAKLSAATNALDVEMADATEIATRLDKAATEAQEALDTSVRTAQENLQAARDESVQKIQEAQQAVQDAQAAADRDIDSHLADLNKAKDDMNRQFGDAIAKVQSAQRDVDSLQGQVNNAQQALNDAQRDLDDAPWWDKIPKAAEVAAAGVRLAGVQASLSSAQAVLTAAKAVIQTPGYLAAQAAIDTYQHAVDSARTAADASIAAANDTLQATITTQDALVTAATQVLQHALSPEAGAAAEAARATYKAYIDSERPIVDALKAAVEAVGKGVEHAAFEAAEEGLKVARANTGALDIARGALEVAKKSGEAVVGVAGWMASHAGGVLDLKRVEVEGDLAGAGAGADVELGATVVGSFVGQDVDFSVRFTPGKGEAMVGEVFERLIGMVEEGLIKIVS